jgi:hypothetical protein
MRWFFSLLGCGLLAAVVVLYLVPEDDSSKTVSEISTVKVESTGAPASPTSTTTTNATTTTEVAPSRSSTQSDKTTKTSSSPASRPSDSLLAALFAGGLALLLLGAFYDRVTTIKAAGVELTLAAKVAEKIAAEVTPTTEEERKRVQAAYLLALNNLPPETSAGDDPVIEAVTKSALETYDFK